MSMLLTDEEIGKILETAGTIGDYNRAIAHAQAQKILKHFSEGCEHGNRRRYCPKCWQAFKEEVGA